MYDDRWKNKKENENSTQQHSISLCIPTICSKTKQKQIKKQKKTFKLFKSNYRYSDKKTKWETNGESLK